MTLCPDDPRGCRVINAGEACIYAEYVSGKGKLTIVKSWVLAAKKREGASELVALV